MRADVVRCARGDRYPQPGERQPWTCPWRAAPGSLYCRVHGRGVLAYEQHVDDAVRKRNIHRAYQEGMWMAAKGYLRVPIRVYGEPATVGSLAGLQRLLDAVFGRESSEGNHARN